MITFNSTAAAGAMASGVFVESEYKQQSFAGLRQQHKVLLLGQYNSGFTPTANAAVKLNSVADAIENYGRGSQLAIMADKAFANGTTSIEIYACPLADDGSAVAATGTVTVTGTATAAGRLALYIAGVEVSVSVAVGDTATVVGDAIVSAVTAKADLPVTASNTAGVVTFTAKWAGESGNQITLRSSVKSTDTVPAGIAVATVDCASGATDPVLDTALANLGDVFYTEIATPYRGATAITAIETALSARKDATIKRPAVAIAGYTDTYANYLAFCQTYDTEHLATDPHHGKLDPEFAIAAGKSAQWAAWQTANPGRPVKKQKLLGFFAEQLSNLTYAQKDAIVKAGGSWNEYDSNGNIIGGDFCTLYKTDDVGADSDELRFVTAISNIQFKTYTQEIVFSGSPFDSAVVVPDGTPAQVAYAVRPDTVMSYLVSLIDDLYIPLGLSGNRDAIIASIIREIDATNPSRINIQWQDQMSSGLRIIAVKYNWDFAA